MKMKLQFNAPILALAIGVSLSTNTFAVRVEGDQETKLLIPVESGSPTRERINELPNPQECDVVANVSGTSGYGKKWHWKSVAKASVLEQAREMRATHVAWQRFVGIGSFNGTAFARLYSCDPEDMHRVSSLMERSGH